MKYCINCGNEILDEAVVCVHCGAKQENYYDKEKEYAKELVKSLSVRLKINALLWSIIGMLQMTSIIFWLTGMINIAGAFDDYNFGDEILRSPYNIVKRHKPLARPIIILIWNFIFGGMWGIVGSIYYFAIIRSFVMRNKEYFELLEEDK